MISSAFDPPIGHPYYFIRKGLLEKIRQYKGEMSGRVLDFGCGSKPYQSLFTYSEYIGVDFENPAHPHTQENVDVFYDGKKLPFPDQHFNSVFSTEVFEHLFNIDDLLSEINRVMLPGGKIMITCPFVWPEHEKPFDFARYTHFAMNNLMEKHGFKILKNDKSGDFITTVFQLRVIYMHDVFFPKLTIPFLVKLAQKTFTPLMNFACRVVRKILPTNQDLYLSNIIIAEKLQG